MSNWTKKRISREAWAINWFLDYPVEYLFMHHNLFASSEEIFPIEPLQKSWYAQYKVDDNSSTYFLIISV